MIFIKFNTGIVNFKFKEFNAAVEDLSACVQIDTDNKSAFTYLVGLHILIHVEHEPLMLVFFSLHENVP